MFAIFAIFGPPLLFLTKRLNQNVNKKIQRLWILYRILQEDQSSLNCARFMEIRLVIYESLKVIFQVFSPTITSLSPSRWSSSMSSSDSSTSSMQIRALWWVTECQTTTKNTDHFHFHGKTGGQLNTQLFKKVYIVSSITMAFFTLPSWLSSVAFSEVTMWFNGVNILDSLTLQDYPTNTVRGRICMGLRLDWDKDRTKETSDIYIKVQRYIRG